MFFTKLNIIPYFFLLVAVGKETSAWGTSEKVKLRDVEVLTLYSGRMTTGRRSSPVPQVKCVGGNAGCTTFIPQVVQCYNRGFDGSDVQWECKTDMDNAYRFGNIQVSCEGYDYPDDPYVLKGSCGLEYTMDLTKEGMSHQGGHNYYGNSYQQPHDFSSHKGAYKSSYFANLACGAVICIIVYAIYKTCITPYEETRQRSTTNQDYPDNRGPGSGAGAPPPGFRRNYYPDQSDSFSGGSDSCSGGANRRAGGLGGGAGGFWTGAATGGLLGYMFGARNNTAGYSGGYSQGFGTGRRGGGFGGFGGDSWGGGGGFSGGGASSSGSRSASGFGGTSRR